MTLQRMALLGAGSMLDSDAAAYIAAVEAADGQALETGVRNAINDFILGCKTDGTWDAIKASCILAGARTLSGALVPLVGTAPTNNNFVSGDYNRKTGLIGNASNKSINSNYTVPSGLRDNAHGAVWVSTAPTSYGNINMGVYDGEFFGNYPGTVSRYVFACNSSSTVNREATGIGASTGLVGQARSSSSQITTRAAGSTTTISSTSTTPSGNAVRIFAGVGPVTYNTNARIAFYSIGESLNLALLDSRVNTLITALAAAIP